MTFFKEPFHFFLELHSNDKPKSKNPQKAKRNRVKLFSFSNSTTTPKKALPTANPVTTSAISSGDYERVRQDFTSKQQALKPIKPASPLGN